MKIRVGVIYGGDTVEHEVSIITAVQAMNYMNKDKYDIIPIYVSKDRTWYTGKMLMDMDVYKDFDNLKRYAVPIVVGIFIGTIIGVISIIISCVVFDLNEEIIASLLPKSVTTPIGIEISSQLGGIIPITVLAILITGIIGAVIAPIVCKVFKIKNQVAIGVAIGTSSHALGTTKALEMGEIEGAMSSLSIGVAGIMTVFIAPATYQLFINLIT